MDMMASFDEHDTDVGLEEPLAEELDGEDEEEATETEGDEIEKEWE